jgi:hypothetical protein
VTVTVTELDIEIIIEIQTEVRVVAVVRVTVDAAAEVALLRRLVQKQTVKVLNEKESEPPLETELAASRETETKKKLAEREAASAEINDKKTQVQVQARRLKNRGDEVWTKSEIATKKDQVIVEAAKDMATKAWKKA